MIVGVGVDIVDSKRFKLLVGTQPAKLIERVLTPEERTDSSGRPRSPDSMAARFAAKEAVAKALGGPPGMSWQDCRVENDELGRPSVILSGSVAAAAEALGVTHWHISLSHDGGIAIAQVIAEAR